MQWIVPLAILVGLLSGLLNLVPYLDIITNIVLFLLASVTTGLVLGTGGAARAAIVAARRLGYEIAVAGRHDEAADRLAARFGVDSLAWDDVAGTEADLYVNATPVGWRAEDPPAVPERVLEGRPLVFDCVYRRDGSLTATIRAARAALDTAHLGGHLERLSDLIEKWGGADE